ncbi:hypothetical protein NDU88_005884 [Pleurodeles waltl]|uniref:Uncharacterized protein n=1 Tax=Pleurodeles waltl TaxID=8319 RepID=A0AAV7PH65_PLEWA|nr:hypothetical protein NDU88_005884 [Pleurodeles waltl]
MSRGKVERLGGGTGPAVKETTCVESNEEERRKAGGETAGGVEPEEARKALWNPVAEDAGSGYLRKTLGSPQEQGVEHRGSQGGICTCHVQAETLLSQGRFRLKERWVK